VPLNAIIGLKKPGSIRGIWKSQTLMSKLDRVEAELVLSKIPGISKTWEDKELPMIAVKLDNFKALDVLRKLPIVDYIHPRYAQFNLLNFGCDNNPSGGMDSKRTKNGQSLHIEPGDILPFYFTAHKIPEAWGRSQSAGANITIGLLDTGIYEEQAEFSQLGFTEGMSVGRSLEKIGNPDTCNHGTHIAGIIAAPRNGKNIVGVAYRANLLSVSSHDSPVIGDDPGGEFALVDAVNIMNALRILREEKGARVIAMAFGNHYRFSSIEDRIRYDYYRADLPSVIYVGAVGTAAPLLNLGCNAPAYPGNMEEVITVAGVDSTGNSEGGRSCSGFGTDVAGMIGKGDELDGELIETTGRYRENVVTLGGSSGGTAIVSGIVALILSEYPWMGRDQLKARLYWASGNADPKFGHGIPNAYKAIGGFAALGIQGPASAYRNEYYTLTAIPTGDGPFSYAWSNGSKSQSIGDSGGGTYTVTVTDTRENKSLIRSHTVRIKTPPKTCPSGQKCCGTIDEGCHLCWPKNEPCP
jgi:subtilisin family serine protease